MSDLDREPQPGDNPLDEEFQADLDAAIDEEIERSTVKDPVATDDKPNPPENSEENGAPAPRDDEPGNDEPVDKDDDGEESPVDTALVERAVRAGLSLEDAQKVSDSDALTRIVEQLESKAAPKGDEDEPPKDEPKDDQTSYLDMIPELDVADGYPPEIVEAFKGIKGAMGELMAENERLKSGGSEGTWADAQYAALDKGFEATFGKGKTAEITDKKQIAAREKVERHAKFFVDEDGLSQEDAFKKAIEVGFGDVAKQIKGSAVKDAASRRSRKAVNRPRNTDGRFASDRDYDDYGNESDREADAVAAVSGMMKEVED